MGISPEEQVETSSWTGITKFPSAGPRRNVASRPNAIQHALKAKCMFKLRVPGKNSANTVTGIFHQELLCKSYSIQ